MRTFKYLLFVGPLLAVLAGCGDIPYSDGSNPVQPPSPPGEPGPPPKTVFASVSGVVDIGNPVFGARVSVHDFKNATQGRELGSSTTDANGHYKIDILERFEGPCLLVSEGGEYVEPSTQQRTLMTATQVLSAPITGLKVENEISINAWTTWASARVKASRTSFKSDKAAILTNLSLMSKHLKKDAEDEAILSVKPVNIFINGVRPDDFNVLLLLSQQGLSALAEETYHVSTAQLILILAEDLADAVFNDSEATRSKLVLKIYETLQKIQTAPKTSKTQTLHFNSQVFLSNDGFFETLSLDPSELLYRKSDAPIHPADLLQLPMLYKLVVDDVEKLKANFDSIVISAEVKSPRLIAAIQASLIELKKTIHCTSDFETDLLATGFPVGKLKTCQVSKEVETVVGDPILLSVKDGHAHGRFPVQPGDLKQEISYKVSVVAKHTNGNDLPPFETAAFSLIQTNNPSLKEASLSQLMYEALTKQELKYADVLEYLARLGAKINLDDFALYYQNLAENCTVAVQKKIDAERVKAFIKYGVPPDAVLDKEGATLLYRAISKNCCWIARVLMESGSDAYRQTKQGDTPLKASIRLADLYILQDMIERGVRLDVQDDAGKTIVDYARQQTAFEQTKLIDDAIFEIKNPEFIRDYLAKAERLSDPKDVLDAGLKLARSDGLYLEMGVYSGRTITWIAEGKPNETIHGFDSFEGLTEDWQRTDMPFKKGHFKVDKPPQVSSNVQLHVGLFNETLPGFKIDNLKGKTIAFLHIDCDIYAATKDVFDVIGDKIVPGTIIVFDELYNYPGFHEHEIKAFSEFLERSGLSADFIAYNQNHEQVAVKIGPRR